MAGREGSGQLGRGGGEMSGGTHRVRASGDKRDKRGKKGKMQANPRGEGGTQGANGDK